MKTNGINFWKVEKELQKEVASIKGRPFKYGAISAFVLALLVVIGAVILDDIFESVDHETNGFFLGATIAIGLALFFGVIVSVLVKFCCNPFKTQDTSLNYVRDYLQKNQSKLSQEELQQYFIQGAEVINQNPVASYVLLNDEAVKVLVNKILITPEKKDEHSPLLINSPL